MAYYLDWETDSAGWPNREWSRFVDAAGLRWHVQVMGEGPPLLLLHGTGASTHSWRDVMPRLAGHYTVIAPDLPGHAFTIRPPSGSLSLPGMASAVAALLRKLEVKPVRAAGHSAGAAVLVRMAADRLFAPADLVSFNGAFFPFGGMLGQFFSPLARTLANATLVQKLFARMADRAAVERLLRDTGSTIDAEGIGLYQRLFSNEGHVAGALGMMAAWDLHRMPQDLGGLPQPLTFVAAGNDRTVPPATAAEAARLTRQPHLVSLPGLGHLAHEEDPAAAAAIILAPRNATPLPKQP
jgi:magnesium chelatase accessory protein